MGEQHQHEVQENDSQFTSPWDSRLEAPRSGTLIPAVHTEYDCQADPGLKQLDDLLVFSLLDATRKLPIREHIPSVISMLCHDNGPQKNELLVLSLTMILQEMETAQANYVNDLEPSIRDMISGLRQSTTALDDDQWNASLECSRDISQQMECSLSAVVNNLNEALKNSCFTNGRRDSTTSSQGPNDQTMTHVVKIRQMTAETTPGSSTEGNAVVEKNSSTGKKKACAHCGISDTPEWRRGPEGPRSVCNACGLFFGKLCKGYGEDVAKRIMRERRSKGQFLERKVPQSFKFNGCLRHKKKY